MKSDIQKYVTDHFPLKDQQQVFFLMEELSNKSWNVGTDQLLRSLLFLSKGDIGKLNDLLPIEDPRDIILLAEQEAGNPGHYFINSFN